MKKIFAVLIAAITLASLFSLAACGKSPSGGNSASSSESAATDSSNQPSTESSSLGGESSSELHIGTVPALPEFPKPDFAAQEDYAVTDEITVAVDKTGANGAYTTVTEAIDALIAANHPATTEKVVTIAAGVYEERVYVPETLKNVTFVGENAETTKITAGHYYGQYDTQGHMLITDDTATVYVFGNGFKAKNVWFENSFDYNNPPADADGSQKQGLAILVKADRAVFDSCIFTGHQDTLEAAAGRQYYKNCTIKGCVDFIFGDNPTAVFEDCNVVTVVRKKANGSIDSNGGYITVAKGNNGTEGVGVPRYCFVHIRSKITAEEGVANGSVALARPWRGDATVAYLYCEIGAHVSTLQCNKATSKRRYVTMNSGKNIPKDAHFYEYKNTGASALTEATEDFTMLTDEEAALYTLENIFAKENGGVTYFDDWDALASYTALAAR